jgi:hypothetical protein
MLKNTLKSTVSVFVFMSCLSSHSSVHALFDDGQLTSVSVRKVPTSLLERGNEIMETLSSIQFKNDKQGTRYDQMKAKKHNKTLNTQDRTLSSKFLSLCKSQAEELEEYSKAIFAHNNRQTKYISSLKRSLIEESKNQSSPEEGYASEFFNPQEPDARRRFIQDAITIFDISEEFSSKADREYASRDLKTFFGFSRLYLGLVRDMLGTLDARDNALVYIGQDLESDSSLTKEHAKIRQKITSAHYLGLAERKIEAIEVLAPLAKIAAQLNSKIINFDRLEYHVNYAKTLIQHICETDHTEIIPTVFVSKVSSIMPDTHPVTKRLEEKERKRQTRARAIATLLGAKNQPAAEDSSLLGVISEFPPQTDRSPAASSVPFTQAEEEHAVEDSSLLSVVSEFPPQTDRSPAASSVPFTQAEEEPAAEDFALLGIVSEFPLQTDRSPAASSVPFTQAEEEPAAEDFALLGVISEFPPQTDRSPAASSVPFTQAEEESFPSESFSTWFSRTGNIRPHYLSSSEVELRRQQKAAKKQAKPKGKTKIQQEPSLPSPVSESVREELKTVVHAPHKHQSKRLCPYHVKEIRNLLTEGGYTTKTVGPRSASQDKKITIGAAHWKVFSKIFNNSFSGEMEKVSNMLRALGGVVDETRNGSRIGIALRHITTREVIGTDFLTIPTHSTE